MFVRWLLGVVAVIGAAGWAAFALLGSEFRRSFGASPAGFLQAVMVPATLVLVLASVIVPTSRALLHVTAVAVAAAALASVLILREAPFLGGTGLCYFALWAFFYWQSAWR